MSKNKFKITKTMLKKLRQMSLGARNRIMNCRAEKIRFEKIKEARGCK